MTNRNSQSINGEFLAVVEFCFAGEFTVMEKLTIDSKKFTIDKKRSLWIVVNGVFQCLENRNSKMKQIVS